MNDTSVSVFFGCSREKKLLGLDISLHIHKLNLFQKDAELWFDVVSFPLELLLLSALSC